ncbi:MAG: helix-turn-helix domain-containing protein [Actinomycetota bacterium]|nr:helix-turn-helix domain-containing protein [Actinomycetota bacterium]
MKNNEIVWRTISDAALQGHRRWEGLSALSKASGVPRSTVQQAMTRLAETGIARQEAGGGFTVVQHGKLLDLVAAHRNLSRDVLARTTIDAANELIARRPARYFIGGPNAAIHHLGGRNTVATPGLRIIYTLDDEIPSLPPSDEALIVRIDPAAGEQWRDGFASPTQTYADLWNTPGWQSVEFTRALRDSLVHDPAGGGDV